MSRFTIAVIYVAWLLDSLVKKAKNLFKISHEEVEDEVIEAEVVEDKENI